MNIELVKKYLESTSEIIKKHEEELDENGSRFNIFSILNLSSSEVRLHSNFIAELLNPKGTHSFKTLFLKLFITKLNQISKSSILDNLDIDSVIVEVEKSTGLINSDYTIGGRIDIVITDKKNNRIIIENKIFAVDQQNQLLRYYNFDKKALLLYLSLNGENPSDWSTNGEIEINKHFYCISYKEFIVQWLKECLEKSISKSNVYETISQYLHIIKDYTQQSQNKSMETKIIDLISSNKEFYNSIEDIYTSYQKFRNLIYEKFWESLRSKRKNDQTICFIHNQVEIKYLIDVDSEGFFFGFYLEKEGKHLTATNEEFSEIANIFRGINPYFKTNEYFIGWVFSNKFKYFYSIEKDKIFDLNNEIEMENFTNEIVTELDQYIENIKTRTNNYVVS